MTTNNPLLMQHASFRGLPLMMSYLTVYTDLPYHEIQGTAMVALIPSILVSAVASRMSAIPPSITACVAVGVFGGRFVWC